MVRSFSLAANSLTLLSKGTASVLSSRGAISGDLLASSLTANSVALVFAEIDC